MEGRSFRPSESGMTRGTPPPSTYPMRLLVVPRSMPTMRDMAPFILSERLGEVVDNGAQIRAGRQTLLEARQKRLAVGAGVHCRVPLGLPGDQRRLLRLPAIFEPLPLSTQPAGRLFRHPRGLRLLQRLLYLEHLLEEVHG